MIITSTLALAAQVLLGPGPQIRGPKPGRMVYTSPMGENFRPGPAGGDGASIWFSGADLDRNGALTVDEMRKDAARFFATLDPNRDGRIDPDEMRRYETQLAPSPMLMPLPPPPGGGELVRETMSGPGGEEPPRGSGPASRIQQSGGGRGQAGPGSPQLVASADTDLDRLVTAQEFASAAGRRFDKLDGNRDRLLRLEEVAALRRRR